MRRESRLPLRYHFLRVLLLRLLMNYDMLFLYDLTRIQSKDALLQFLNLEAEIFESVLTFDPIEASTQNIDIESLTYQNSWFIRHKIPKRDAARGDREVWEAIQPLANIYKALARRLDSVFRDALSGYPPKNAYGFVRGRGTRDNAALHVGKRNLLRTDVQNFFPSINRIRVEQLLTQSGANAEIAELLGAFVTIGGNLPLGLSTSPVISNALCIPMDCKLNELAQRYQSTYSRYADDLTFSGDVELPDIKEIEAILEEHEFSVAHNKTRQTKIGQAHYVTGLSVSDPNAPHAPKKMKRELRQELYYAKKFGLDEHLGRLGLTDRFEYQQYINRLDGLVRYVSHHEPRMAKHLCNQWQNILDVSGEGASFHPKNQDSKPFVLAIDETEFDWRGRRLLALGISASQNQDLINEMTARTLRDFLSDQYADGKYDALRKNGLHYQDATQDLILNYVKVLQKLPFNGYVVFGELRSPAQYADTYIRLLEAVIKRRLMAAESLYALLCFEENSKVSQTRLKGVVDHAYAQLRETNNRRPMALDVKFDSKSNSCVCAPDFLLGVLRKYLTSGPAKQPPSREQLMFERLRDKYRVILDADSGVEYSRRNPLTP